MKMLFVLLTTLAAVASASQWVALPSPPSATRSINFDELRTDLQILGESRTDRLLADNFDVRGHYGALLLLVVEDEEELHRLQQAVEVAPQILAEYNEETQQLTVVERPVGWQNQHRVPWFQAVQDGLSGSRETFMREKVLFIERGRFVLLGGVGQFSFPRGTDEIPVAFHSIQPPREHFDITLFPNVIMKDDGVHIKSTDDRIEGMVSEVSAASLRDSVQELSTVHWSRLSFSPYAFDAQRWLENKFLDFGLSVSRFTFNEEFASSVVADIPGTQSPNLIVLVGAHLDSRQEMNQDPFARAPGADDNGSGIAMLLELAKILTSYKYRYTIRLVGWTGEEQGLVGSRAYATQAREQGMNLIGVLNGDMLGYKPPENPYMVGFKDRNISPLLTEFCMDVVSQYTGFPSAFSSSCCSDYLPFDEEGFAAVGFFENNITAAANPNYHRSTDSFEYLDYDLAEIITQGMLASAAEMAQIV